MKILALTLYSGNYSNGYFFFFPASGYRYYSDGILRGSGKEGDGWTSMPSGSDAWYLRFLSGIAHVVYSSRGYGFPVRCVQASAAVFAFTNDTFCFFPASGWRRESDGALRDLGVWGFSWSSLPSDGRAWALEFYSGIAHVDALARNGGWPVRCVQASAAVFAFIKKDIEDTFVFFPASGYRESPGGKLSVSGIWGYGWSSTPSAANRAYALEFYSGTATVYGDYIDCGFPVRCVQASAIVFAFTNDTFCFFPATGYREFSDGRYSYPGSWGLVWASTPSGGNAWSFTISSGRPYMNANNRGYGFTVRCVQASATVWAVKKENIKQIRFRRESGKGILYRRGRADSVTRLGRKLFASGNYFVCATPSYSISLINLPVFKCLYFYKHSSGYFLFFPATGFRFLDAKLYNVGTEGHGWTSTLNGSNAWHYGGSSGNVALAVHSHEFGFPVRCVQASAVVFVKKDFKEAHVFFPASGVRHESDGSLRELGSCGYARSSTPAGGSDAWELIFYSGNACIFSYPCSRGFPVRCVQASATVFAFIKKDIEDTLFFFPASGFRAPNDGLLGNSGLVGYCWMSTPAGGSYAYSLYAPSGTVRVANHVRDDGFSVRCVQASATVFVFIKKDFKYISAFFPASGYRFVGDGKLVDSGITVLRWSSTPYNSGSAWDLNSRSAAACMYYDSRGHGFPVRCVQASAAVWAVRKKDAKQIRFRRESGEGILFRRGQADSVTRLGRKSFANENCFVCAVPSYSISLIKLPDLKCLYFYKYSSGYFFFFPAPGYRETGDGKLYNSGGRGDGWSSTPNGDRAMGLLFDSGNVRVYDGHWRGSGFPVRCVQASATVFVFIRKDIEDTFIFFTASGYRLNSDGGLRNSGTYGYGWTSTPDGGGGSYLYFSAGGPYISHYDRDSGRSVRCVQASATVFAFSYYLKRRKKAA